MDATDAPLRALIEQIRAAVAAGTGLRIRGGGSKDFYGQAPAGELLDTRPLTGITAYEPSELYVTVRAGTSLAELEALLARNGQCLPFEPPRFSSDSLPQRPAEPGGLVAARNDLLPLPLGEGRGEGPPAEASANATSPTTVGGMVAAGLSGPARANAGSVRDYLLGATMVNGRAELLTFGGQVMKNVAGYDVSRVLAGSLGTLGLIAEVSLKVLPVAPGEATLVFEMDQATALKALDTWGGRPLPLNASCWTGDAGGGALHLRLRGAVAAVEAACRQLGGERMPAEVVDAVPGSMSLARTPIRRDPSAQANVAAYWNTLRDQSHPFFAPRPGQCLWRLSVPQGAAPLPLPHLTLIEWHGAQRWLHAPANQADIVRAAALQAGGHATLFRAADEADRSARVFAPLASPLERIHRELKKQFDPAGIFNPGRLYPGL